MADFKYIISKPQEMEPFCKCLYNLRLVQGNIENQSQFGTKELLRIVSMAYMRTVNLDLFNYIIRPQIMSLNMSLDTPSLNIHIKL